MHTKLLKLIVKSYTVENSKSEFIRARVFVSSKIQKAFAYGSLLILRYY